MGLKDYVNKYEKRKLKGKKRKMKENGREGKERI